MTEVARRFEPRFDLLGVNPKGVAVDRANDFVECDVTRGRVLGKDSSAPAFQVGGQNFEHMTRDLEKFFLELAGRDIGGGAAHDDRARAVVAEPPGASLSVALDHS